MANKLLLIGGAALAYWWYKNKSTAGAAGGTSSTTTSPNTVPADIAAPTGSTSISNTPWQPASFGTPRRFIYSPSAGARPQQNLYYPAPPAQMRQAMGSGHMAARVSSAQPSRGGKYRIIDAEYEPM